MKSTFTRLWRERSFLVASTLAMIIVGAIRSAVAEDIAVVPINDTLRQRCVDVLQQAFKGNEFWPSMHAAEGLTLAGQGKEVIEALRPRVAGEADHQHRCGLVREIVRAGERAPLPILFETLADTQSNGRVHAAESLYKIAEIGDGQLMRQSMAQPGNLRLQLMAAAALGRNGSPDAIQFIRSQLTSTDAEVRKIAVWLLGLLGDARDIEPIRKVQAKDDDPLTLAYCVNALACLGDPKGREQLKRNLTSDDAPTRTYAAEFAGYCRAVECHAELVRLLDDKNVDVRARAAQSLIVLADRQRILALPTLQVKDQIRVEVYPASPSILRYSEGSVVTLSNGRLLYATTKFSGGAADHATAAIVGRESVDGGRTWGESRVLQENIGKQNVMSVTLRRLRRDDTGPIGMFFLVKNSATDLKVLLRVSSDDCRTFAEPIVVTDAPGYHVMNNDRVTILRSGRIICPIAWCDDVSKGGHFVCRCFLSDDGGKTWRVSVDSVDQPKRGAMEPEVVELGDGRLMMIIRTQLGHIATSFSEDGDRWSTPTQLSVPAPESPSTIRIIPSTGDLLLVWNRNYEASVGHGGKRTPLTAAISNDAGKTWRHVQNLESDPDAGYAYTSILFHKDRVLLSYYVDDGQSHRISSRFLSLPVRSLYEPK